jgi:hypothetical protein
MQRLFSFLEAKGVSVPGIHRDASCAIMAAIFVFCLHVALQFAVTPTTYVYLVCAGVAAVVEGKWLLAHANLAKTSKRADVIELYRVTADFNRAQMLPLRLISIGYLLAAPFIFSFDGRLDLISWLLVFLYGCKFYLMCCLPGAGVGKEMNLNAGDVVL